MAHLVVVRTYVDYTEALVARSILEQHGLTVFLFDSYYVAVNWLRLFAVGGMRLAVVDTDAEAAAALLLEVNDLSRDDGVEHCPACGSGEVFRIRSWLAGFLGFLCTAQPLFVVTRRRRCRRCGHRWRSSP